MKIPIRQEAQMSQRNRATLRVIEYFAKSLKITQGYCRNIATNAKRTLAVFVKSSSNGNKLDYLCYLIVKSAWYYYHGLYGSTSCCIIANGQSNGEGRFSTTHSGKITGPITGSALALHCCKAHAKINGYRKFDPL